MNSARIDGTETDAAAAPVDAESVAAEDVADKPVSDEDTRCEPGAASNEDTACEPGATSTDAEGSDETAPDPARRDTRRISWGRVVAFGVLPTLALVLMAAAGYLKWLDGSDRDSHAAQLESVRAATDGTVAILSYKADSAEKDLGAARDRLTGQFKDAYISLTHDVVIPGAKEKHISAVANVPGAASVSATPVHAVVVVFVDQTVTVGNDPPTATASVVRVTLDKFGGRWLISAFDPI